VRLQARLQRLERCIIVEQGHCPACRDRHGRTVFVRSRQQPDGTLVPLDPELEPCARCGEVPEGIVEIVEVVVTSRSEWARLQKSSGQSLSGLA
jgi:hypothetical protein